MEIAQVNLPVGLLIWVMIIPMLVKVDFGALHEVRQHVRGIGVTLFVNWLVKPFSMAFLGCFFIRNLFAPMLPADQTEGSCFNALQVVIFYLLRAKFFLTRSNRFALVT